MVQWLLRVEACHRQVWVQFPAPAVISDLVVLCQSSKPSPCRTGLKVKEVHYVFEHPRRSLKIPSANSQRVADFRGHRFSARFEYYGLRFILQLISLSALNALHDSNPNTAVIGCKHPPLQIQIGRASCRERVQISVVAVSLKKKQHFIPTLSV